MLNKHGISVSETAQDLIKKMLEKDPSKRLGSENGANEILEHTFFDELDIDDLMEGKIKPEFVPEISEDDKYDLKNFDQEVTNLAAKESFINDEEREKIIDKVKSYKGEFEQIDNK